MKAKTIAIAILAIGLLAGATTAVVAQGAPADQMAPAYFTGTYGEPAESRPPQSEEPGPNGVQMRGMRLSGIPVETTDPRFSGVLDVVANGAGNPLEVGGSRVERRSLRLTTPDGAGSWVGTSSDILVHQGDQGPPLLTLETAEFVGEGAFAGLTAYVINDGQQDPPVRGVIYAVEQAPVPGPIADG